MAHYLCFRVLFESGANNHVRLIGGLKSKNGKVFGALSSPLACCSYAGLNSARSSLPSKSAVFSGFPRIVVCCEYILF